MGTEGDTGTEGEMGMDGEALRRGFLEQALAFSLRGSIRPSHILQIGKLHKS